MKETTELTLDPESVMIIGDDETATRYAALCGLPVPTQFRGRHPKEACFQIEFKHPTHWIAIGNYRGFEEDFDNGPVFIAHPKGKMGKEGFMNILRSYFTLEGGYTEVERL